MTFLNPHAGAVLALTAAAFWFYTRPWARVEHVSLGLLGALLVLFYAFPYVDGSSRLDEVEVFRALGHPALVAICCLMILGRGLTMTGALEPGVRVLVKIWRRAPAFGFLLALLAAGLMSAFVNDTPVLVLMLPMLLGLAERTGTPAAKTLMPTNFAILTGGMLTAIGTSTNLLVLSIAVDLGMRPLGVFSFFTIALPAFVLALLYLWLIAPRLLSPNGPATSIVARTFEARLPVKASGDRDDAPALAGRTLADLDSRLGRELPAIALWRSGAKIEVSRQLRLEAGDEILLRDTPSGLRDIAAALAVDLYDRDGPGRFLDRESSRADTHFIEVVLGSESALVGRTLKSTRFAAEHHVLAIGLNQGTEGLARRVPDLADAVLAVGDVLLLQGPPDRLEALRGRPGLMVLDSQIVMPRSKFATAAMAIMLAVVAASATKILPIHVAAFLGAIAMLAVGCIRIDGVGRALSLEVVLLVASSIALGQSLVVTGAAGWIAGHLANAVAGLPPAFQLSVFMAFAAVLTNFVSNAAAAAVGTPIAVATARALGLPLEPFVLAILFGANLSFATPMAYQTNLLVMNAAGYTFRDFVRVGVPLVVILLCTLAFTLVRRYGL